MIRGKNSDGEKNKGLRLLLKYYVIRKETTFSCNDIVLVIDWKLEKWNSFISQLLKIFRKPLHTFHQYFNNMEIRCKFPNG